MSIYVSIDNSNRTKFTNITSQSEEIRVLKRMYLCVVFSCGGFPIIWLADYLILSNICSIFIVTVVFISHANRNSLLRKTLVLSTEPSSNDLLVLLVPTLSHSVIHCMFHFCITIDNEIFPCYEIYHTLGREHTNTHRHTNSTVWQMR